MQQYLDLIDYVLVNGTRKPNRTGVDTISCFGYQNRYDLSEGFPLLTTKKVNFDSVARELLWFLSGSTNINELHPSKIWDEWADKNGNLGPVYGKQWVKLRNHHASECDGEDLFINQIQNVIERIKTHPDCRRLIVSAWNVEDIPQMALAPCHCFFQFYVVNGRLDCQLYQRSADVALGVPFNIASYALLTAMVAKECNLVPGIFVHTFGDVHIYVNHIEGLQQQLSRNTRQLPTLTIADKYFWDIKLEDIVVNDYNPHPFIKFDVAV